MKRQPQIGPIDSFFGALAICDWVRPTIQFVKSCRDVYQWALGDPLPWYVQIHGGDMPRAIAILQDYGILGGGIFPTYGHVLTSPLDPWQGVRVPADKFAEIISEFEFVGVRYKV